MLATAHAPHARRAHQRQGLPTVGGLPGTLSALGVSTVGVRVNVPDHELIAEAISVGRAGGANAKTMDKYEDHLEHFSLYLSTAQRGLTFYTAQRKHMLMFLGHLAEHGGENPHPSRLDCEWCRQRGYPDGRGGAGWSASTRKGYLSAIRFLYAHFCAEEDLPTIDPSAHVTAPKVITRLGYTPSHEDVRKLLAARGRPTARLLVHWMFYAPSRLSTFVAARWCDLDLDNNLWHLIGKGGKPDVFDLHPLLARELRAYRRHVERISLTNRAVRNALAFEDTA